MGVGVLGGRGGDGGRGLGVRGLGGLGVVAFAGGCRGGQVGGLVDGGGDDGHFVGAAAAEEEGAQLHGGFLGEDAADDLCGVGHACVA